MQESKFMLVKSPLAVFFLLSGTFQISFGKKTTILKLDWCLSIAAFNYMCKHSYAKLGLAADGWQDVLQQHFTTT